MNKLNTSGKYLFPSSPTVSCRSWAINEYIDSVITCKREGISEFLLTEIVRNIVISATVTTIATEEFVNDRLGHDLMYAIDSSYISKVMGFDPRLSLEEGIKETIDWYLQNLEWLKKKTSNN